MKDDDIKFKVERIIASLEMIESNPIVDGHVLGIDIGIEDLVKLYM